jgi:carbamoyl-phosphate synthase large subunit
LPTQIRKQTEDLHRQLKRSEGVLVTASGSVVGQGIMKCLKLANAKSEGPNYRIVATDASPLAAGLYRGDAGVIVPAASDPEYVNQMVAVCRKSDVSAVFVGSDEEHLPLARAKKRIEEEAGVKVIVNPLEVLERCTDKWATYIFLRENGLPSARSAVPDGDVMFQDAVGFPMVVKPREGHGSLDIHIANNGTEVSLAKARIESSGKRPIFQEYLGDDANEFTTGVTVTRDGKSVMSSIAMRRTLKGGQTYKAFIDDFDEVRESAEKVALKLGASGPVNVQSRMVDGVPKVFEINPRLSASCPMRAVAGVNEPDILFRNFVLGKEVQVQGYQKLISMRYWNEVYVRASTFEKTEKEREFRGPDSVVLPYF